VTAAIHLCRSVCVNARASCRGTCVCWVSRDDCPDPFGTLAWPCGMLPPQVVSRELVGYGPFGTLASWPCRMLQPQAVSRELVGYGRAFHFFVWEAYSRDDRADQWQWPTILTARQPRRSPRISPIRHYLRRALFW
jgi:hypothetical protein